MSKMSIRFNISQGLVNLDSYINNIEKKIEDLNKSNVTISESTSEHLLTLRKLHKILQNGQHLTDQQKFDFCSSERYFMKLYLRELNKG
jgi:hypothetical protein